MLTEDNASVTKGSSPDFHPVSNVSGVHHGQFVVGADSHPGFLKHLCIVFMQFSMQEASNLMLLSL